MRSDLLCWHCGAELEDEPLPLARTAECRKCRAELHVCRFCRFFDPRVAEQCNEDRADPPVEKTRANFCDYFQANPDAHTPADDSEEKKARAELEALFGNKNKD